MASGCTEATCKSGSSPANPFANVRRGKSSEMKADYDWCEASTNNSDFIAVKSSDTNSHFVTYSFPFL